MIFTPKLIPATLLSRYKRFLADVKMPDGETITVHCPNTGTMRTCSTPNSPIMLSISDNPKRKYPHTLEMIREQETWVGVNTSRTNALVAEALNDGKISEFSNIEKIQREVTVSKSSRLDLLIHHDNTTTYMEIKNCSMVEQNCAMFPDAITTRGTKHLRELIELKKKGENASVFFLVQRTDADEFSPAAHIDPTYAEQLKIAHHEGVLVLAYQATVTTEKISVLRSLPIRL